MVITRIILSLLVCGGYQYAAGLRSQQMPDKPKNAKRAIVIVRTYLPQIEMIDPLTRYLLDGSTREVDIKFLIQPTESKDLAKFQELATNLRSSGLDIEVPPFLRPAVYAEVRRNTTKCECPPVSTVPQCVRGNKLRQDKLRLCKCADLYQQFCVYENEAHYRLTDLTIDYAMKLTQGSSNYAKTSLLVTNGDNVYRKSFLAQLMSVPEPIAISDFAERPSTHSFVDCNIKTRVQLGQIDLGAYIVDMEVLREHHARFTTSIPSFANDTANLEKMSWFHNADFWFINSLVKDKKIPHKIIHECMFLHLLRF